MSSIAQLADRAYARLLGILIGLVATSIALIAVLIPTNLLLVKLQWGNMWWLHEAVEYALYDGVFLGAPWVLRQGAQHALLLCAEACWLAPNTMPWVHCSTPCWLVQYCQCADWHAGCASPRVARGWLERRGCRST